MIATVTHARVRAAQGDVAGALRVLRGVLAGSPNDPEALRLRAELTGTTAGGRRRAAGRLRAWIAQVKRRRAS